MLYLLWVCQTSFRPLTKNWQAAKLGCMRLKYLSYIWRDYIFRYRASPWRQNRVVPSVPASVGITGSNLTMNLGTCVLGLVTYVKCWCFRQLNQLFLHLVCRELEVFMSEELTWPLQEINPLFVCLESILFCIVTSQWPQPLPLILSQDQPVLPQHLSKLCCT